MFSLVQDTANPSQHEHQEPPGQPPGGCRDMVAGGGGQLRLVLASCPDERLEPGVDRQGVVEGVHHVDVLVEQHVAPSQATTDLEVAS